MKETVRVWASPRLAGLRLDPGSNIPKAPPVAVERVESHRPGWPSPRALSWEDWAAAAAGIASRIRTASAGRTQGFSNGKGR